MNANIEETTQPFLLPRLNFTMAVIRHTINSTAHTPIRMYMPEPEK
jgi:hypothetical protein